MAKIAPSILSADFANMGRDILELKEAGADCVKIQTYTPDTLTIDCDNKYFAITDGTWKGEN